MKFVVEGMTCGHCVKAVTAAIQKLDGAAQVLVDLAAGTVQIDGRIAQEDAVRAIQDSGYTVTRVVESAASSGPGQPSTCCGGCSG